MGRRLGRQALPVDPGDEPQPLRIVQLPRGVARLRPDELAAMQTALTQPHAVAIPAHQLEPRMASVAEYVGAAVARSTPKRLLHVQGKSVDTGAHVDRLRGQPNRFHLQLHARARSRSASQLEAYGPAARAAQAERRCRRRGRSTHHFQRKQRWRFHLGKQAPSPIVELPCTVAVLGREIALRQSAIALSRHCAIRSAQNASFSLFCIAIPE